MSGPLFSYRHPFEGARRPTLEPEVKRAILASWASAAAVPTQPALRRPPRCDQVLPVEDVFEASRMVDCQQVPGRDLCA